VTAHPLDLAVVAAYAVSMVAFGLYFYFKVNRYSEYYDGGRTWGVWIVGCAVDATNIGAGNTMGSVAMAYREGYSAALYDRVPGRRGAGADDERDLQPYARIASFEAGA
jgi:Na+/proline symporter